MKHPCTVTVAILLLCVSMFSLATASDVEAITVSPLTTKTLTFSLKDGQRFSGSLSISGGSGDDIDFWVTDPVGANLLNLGRVSHGRSFEFTANRDGACSLHFGNDFSLFSTKTVYLTYDVSDPQILGTDAFLFKVIVVVVALILIVAIVAIVLSRRKPRRKAPPPPPPPPPVVAMFPIARDSLGLFAFA